jgi:hypothetical protein
METSAAASFFRFMKDQIRVPGAPDLLSTRFHHRLNVFELDVQMQLNVRKFSRDRSRILLQQHFDTPASRPERGTDWILLGVNARRPIHALLEWWLARVEFVFAYRSDLDGTIERKGPSTLAQMAMLTAALEREFFPLIPRDIADGEDESLWIATLSAVRLQLLAEIQPNWQAKLRAYYEEIARSSGQNVDCAVLEGAAEEARAPRQSNLPKWTNLPH